MLDQSAKSELILVKETHEYFIGLKKVPSVSEIMRPLTEGAISKVPQRQLEIARDRGLGVHQAIEDYVKFDVEDDEFEDYLFQFKKMLSENNFTVLHCEYMMTDGEFAGTLDLIVEDDLGRKHIVDTKTTYAISPYVTVQLGAYSILTSYNGIDITWCYVFHVKPNKYSLVKKTPDIEQGKELYDIWKNKSNQHTD